MSNEQKPGKELDIVAFENVGVGDKPKADTEIIASVITPTSCNPTSFNAITPSTEIVRQAVAANNAQVPPEEEKRIARVLDGVREFKSEWEVSFETAGFSLGPGAPYILPIRFRFAKKSEGKK